MLQADYLSRHSEVSKKLTKEKTNLFVKSSEIIATCTYDSNRRDCKIFSRLVWLINKPIGTLLTASCYIWLIRVCTTMGQAAHFKQTLLV